MQTQSQHYNMAAVLCPGGQNMAALYGSGQNMAGPNIPDCSACLVAMYILEEARNARFEHFTEDFAKS